MELIINGVKEPVWPAVKDQKGRLLIGKFIGSVEEVVNCWYTREEGYDYETDYFLAYQLINGPIVAIDDDLNNIRKQNNVNVHSLKGRLFSLHKGFYPIEFPEDWMDIKPIPTDEQKGGITHVETDELPF